MGKVHKSWVKKQRFREEARGRCFICGKRLPGGWRGRRATNLHHVMPKSRGGGNQVWNLVTVHQHCNQRVGNRLPTVRELIRLARQKRSWRPLRYVVRAIFRF